MLLLKSTWLVKRMHGIRSYLVSLYLEEVKLPSTIQVGILGIILTTSIILSGKNYNSFQLGSYQDDTSYAVLARSIVSADAYGLMNVPGKPLATRYPFGFPLLLSPLVWLFPTTPDKLKFVSLIATILNIFLIFWGWPYLSQNRSYWWGLGIAALYGVSPLVIGHTRMVMSEPAFTTFALISLILCEKYLASSNKRFLPILACGVLLFFTLFIRLIGVALVIAIMVRVLLLPLHRTLKVRRLIYLLFGGVFFTGLIIIVTPIKISDLVPFEYANQFEQPQAWGQAQAHIALIPRVWDAFIEYAQQFLREAVIPIGGGSRELEIGLQFGIPNLPLLIGVLIGGVIFLGTLAVFQKNGLQPSVLIFEVLFFGGNLLWPWRGSRFLYPILPFLFFQLLCGIKLLLTPIQRIKFLSSDQYQRLEKFSVVIVFLFILILSTYKGIIEKDQSTQFIRDLTIGSTWLNENSPANAVIMAQQPQSIYLYSGHYTVDFPKKAEFRSVDDFETILKTQHINYIMVAPEMIWHQDGLLKYDQFTSETILPILDTLEQQQAVSQVYQSKTDLVKIYQIHYP